MNFGHLLGCDTIGTLDIWQWKFLAEIYRPISQRNNLVYSDRIRNFQALSFRKEDGCG